MDCLEVNNRIRNSGNIQLLCFARFNQIVRPFSVFPSIYFRFCSLPSILLIGCYYFASWQTTSTFYCYRIVLWWMNYYEGWKQRNQLGMNLPDMSPYQITLMIIWRTRIFSYHSKILSFRPSIHLIIHKSNNWMEIFNRIWVIEFPSHMSHLIANYCILHRFRFTGLGLRNYILMRSIFPYLLPSTSGA